VAFEATFSRGEFFGTPEQVADKLINWVEQGNVSGFIINGPVLTEALDDIVRWVLPVLQQRGYWAPDNDSQTLRERLELPFKQNRYTKVAAITA